MRYSNKIVQSFVAHISSDDRIQIMQESGKKIQHLQNNNSRRKKKLYKDRTRKKLMAFIS